jgi:hypothetical protein
VVTPSIVLTTVVVMTLAVVTCFCSKHYLQHYHVVLSITLHSMYYKILSSYQLDLCAVRRRIISFLMILTSRRGCLECNHHTSNNKIV